MADITPLGNAASADKYLTAAGEGIHFPAIGNKRDDDPARQVAALQGIGWALLAVCDQLADLADAAADNGGQLAEIACAVEALTAPRPRRARDSLTAILARLLHIGRAGRPRAGTVELTSAQAVIVRQALADAAAGLPLDSEDPEHAGDGDLADTYTAQRARPPGSGAL